MANFNEVIKQFKRMCRYTNYSGLTTGCPLYQPGRGCNISHCRKLAFDDEKFAGVVMAWAAEHPELVYPTWWEWLENMGIVGKAKSEYSEVFDTISVGMRMFDPIPADIAQKLGIEPREDVC